MPEFFEEVWAPPILRLPIRANKDGKRSRKASDLVVVAYAEVCDGEWARTVLTQMRWKRTQAGYPINANGQYLHHLIYEHYSGQPSPKGWSGKQLDHEDRNTLNNKPGNIRLVCQSVQKANRGLNKNNESGFKGVHKIHGGKWRARIMKNYSNIHLGCFSTPEEAARAVNEAYRKYYPSVAIPNPQVEN